MVSQCIVMIRKNLINCKLTREKRPEKMIFKEYMDRLRPGVETCPCCGCRGKMRIHAYYGRSLVGISGDRPVKEDLCVCRLICPQCRHSTTHAILPDPIIPYRRHSLFFILRVLAEHAIRLRSVERICEVYGISVRTFYRWERLFHDHRTEWQDLLSAAETDLKSSLLALVRKAPFSSFAAFFIRLTGFSLLQAHRNPAHSRRRSTEAADLFP